MELELAFFVGSYSRNQRLPASRAGLEQFAPSPSSKPGGIGS